MKLYRVWKDNSEKEERWLSVAQVIELRRQGYYVEQAHIGFVMPPGGKSSKKKEEK